MKQAALAMLEVAKAEGEVDLGRSSLDARIDAALSLRAPLLAGDAAAVQV